MSEIKEIKTICPNPGCDKDIVIDVGKVKRAIMRRKMFDGKAVAGCPICCHVMVLPDEIPDDMTLFEEFIVEKNEENEDWCDCVPLLPETVPVANLPAGHIDVHGTTMYKPGTGAKAMDKYTYMKTLGIDPECGEYHAGRPIVKVGT
jgi:hypothetical protein